jgi:hypothetical protein
VRALTRLLLGLFYARIEDRVRRLLWNFATPLTYLL